MHELRYHSAQNSASYVGFFLARVFSIFSHPANLCENDNKVEPEGTEYSVDGVMVHKKLGSDLIGTWERKGTVSISRLEGIDVIYIPWTSYRVARSKSPK